MMSGERRYIFRHGKRIEVETLDTGLEAKARARRRQRFVKLPLAWFDRLGEINASGSTYRVAIYILWKAWSRREHVVKFPQVPGVSRNGRRIALRKLELAGLISINQRPKRSPIVTVLSAD